MARIAGVDLPREKRVEIGLTYIFGIGRKSADDILAATGVNPDTRVKTFPRTMSPNCVTISTRTTLLKAIFAGMWDLILKD